MIKRLRSSGLKLNPADSAVSDVVDARPLEPICVRVPEAVRLTGIGRSTLYELINAGDIETVKVGRSTFIKYDSLKRLFERH